MAVSLLGAYAIVVHGQRWTGVMFRCFMVGFAVPIQALMIPLYLTIVRIGLYDSLLGLILPMAAFSLPITILVLVNFLRDVPRSLIDAMRVDGAGPLRVLLRLVLPLSWPAIATVGVFNLVTSWNNFVFPLILTQSPSQATLPLAVFNFEGNHLQNVPEIMAAVALSAVPLFVLFPRPAPAMAGGGRHRCLRPAPCPGPEPGWPMFDVLTGSYAPGRAGVRRFRFDPERRTFTAAAQRDGVPFAAYLARSDATGSYYAVSETTAQARAGPGTSAAQTGRPGAVWALGPDPASPPPASAGAVPTGGELPTHIAVHPSGCWLAVANYGCYPCPGSVSIVGIHPDGSLTGVTSQRWHDGHGPVASRQDVAHVHSTVFDATGDRLIAADLGADALVVYAFGGRGAAQRAVHRADATGLGSALHAVGRHRDHDAGRRGARDRDRRLRVRRRPARPRQVRADPQAAPSGRSGRRHPRITGTARASTYRTAAR